MTSSKKISPLAIAKDLQLGIRRQAFQIAGPLPVAFRASAFAEAQRLSLRGSIDESDGGMRGLVEGSASDIDAFFDWCADNASSPADATLAVIDVTGEDTRPLPWLAEFPPSEGHDV